MVWQVHWHFHLQHAEAAVQKTEKSLILQSRKPHLGIHRLLQPNSGIKTNTGMEVKKKFSLMMQIKMEN